MKSLQFEVYASCKCRESVNKGRPTVPYTLLVCVSIYFQRTRIKNYDFRKGSDRFQTPLSTIQPEYLDRCIPDRSIYHRTLIDVSRNLLILYFSIFSIFFVHSKLLASQRNQVQSSGYVYLLGIAYFGPYWLNNGFLSHQKRLNFEDLEFI